MLSWSRSTGGTSTRPGRSGRGEDEEIKSFKVVHSIPAINPSSDSPLYMSVTTTADNGGHENSQVTVVQLQRVEACCKLELGLHHVAKWPPEALEELPSDEAAATSHQEAIFVHAGGQESEECFVHAILQERNLNTRQKWRAEHGFMFIYCKMLRPSLLGIQEKFNLSSISGHVAHK